MADKHPKYVRQPQYDQPGAEAWELVEHTTEGDGWTGKRIGYTAKGVDPNKVGANEAKK